ncbi:hypothetical protein LJB86_02735 [Deltaproteobacteria bacterium OttesenSCG-928-M10]|nr:hypothetical protein [Deltaproteobacteria bacterium OttesenSCG-928-M10]
MAEGLFFSTWRELANQLKNDLANPAFRTMQSYSVAGRVVTYRSLKDLRDLLDWAEEEAAKEEGTAFPRCVYAKNGGRG